MKRGRGPRPLSADGARLLDRLAATPQLLLFLDVDGTLARLAPHPDLARVPAATRSLIRRLRAHRRVRVALVSGRAAVDARKLLGVPVDWTIGNHGFEVASGRSPPWPLAPASLRRNIRRARRAIVPAIAGLDGVWIEDKGWTLAVHFPAASHGARAGLYRRVRAAVRGLPVMTGLGKRVVDLRPRVSWHKGEAVRAILRRAGMTLRGAVYAGDDRTDEYAFRALPPPAVTIKVGRGPTRARHRTASPAALAAWLARLERRLR